MWMQQPRPSRSEISKFSPITSRKNVFKWIDPLSVKEDNSQEILQSDASETQTIYYPESLF